MLSFWRYVNRSLWGHARLNAAVALAAAAATAVLTGALLVGDSVRGSLRHLVLDRLGSVQEILLSDHYFRQALPAELHQRLPPGYTRAVGAILLPHCSAASADSAAGRRASQVLVVAASAEFWSLYPRSPASDRWGELTSDQVVLNQALADDLGVVVGQRLTIRLPAGDQIPADSVLARKTDLVRSMAQLEVVKVIPNDGPGRFALYPNQGLPRNAFVALSRAQRTLRLDGKINAILAASGDLAPTRLEQSQALQAALQPTLNDYGLAWESVRQADDATDPLAYEQLTSERMTLSSAVESEAERTLGPQGGQAFFTYLANRLEKVAPQTGQATSPIIPYSLITGVPESFELRSSDDAPAVVLRENDIALNQWAAWQLDARLGDQVRVSYFDPESAHGVARETQRDFTVAVILPLAHQATRRDSPSAAGQPPPEFAARPTRYNDSRLTPTVKGFTDQASIDDWDPPFPYDSQLIQDRDEEYWDQHRTTPKAMIALDQAQRIWGSRFGRVTTYHAPATVDEATGEARRAALLAALAPRSQELGMSFTPTRRRDLTAASGTTPFDVLFLLLSMFIIGSALMLTALLFRLGVEQRASELGVLAAVGFTPKRIGRLFLAEGAAVASLGGLAGVALGVAYAALMLMGLRTWWSGAVVTPFLQLHVGPLSLLLGWLIGVTTSLGAVWLALRRICRTAPRRLLAGQTEDPRLLGRASASRWPAWLAAAAAIAAIGLGFAALRLSGEAQAGAFVGSGALFLAAMLLLAWRWLRGGAASQVRGWSLVRLAARNAGRNSLRSTMTLGLVAVATFLIVSMSAFHLSPSDEGSGGFNLVAESSQPIFDDLNDAQARRAAILNNADSLAGANILALRVQAGDDATCRNLYQATQPRVLGVSAAMVAYFDRQRPTPFAFAAVIANQPELIPAANELPVGEGLPPAAKSNPWRSLLLPESAAVPVILDMNTAMYSLHLYGGIGQEFSFDYGGNPVKFRVVGLLSNSILQGNLLISESHFLRQFPDASGYRQFLLRTPPAAEAPAASALEEAFANQGLDVRPSRDVLADLLAVQNTYLSTFQSLGLLGLLLGTFGLATVQLRGIVERRGELALMRAIGFAPLRLARLVMWENLWLLLGGMGAGLLSALLSLVPYWLAQQAGLPGGGLLWMLALVALVGVATGLASVAAVLRAPLVPALKKG